eukprot:422769-Prorocentrum_minimum.AAC.1
MKRAARHDDGAASLSSPTSSGARWERRASASFDSILRPRATCYYPEIDLSRLITPTDGRTETRHPAAPSGAGRGRRSEAASRSLARLPPAEAGRRVETNERASTAVGARGGCGGTIASLPRSTDFDSNERPTRYKA